MGFEGSNIYRVWIPHKNRIIRSRDVRIDESVRYSGEQSELEPRLQVAIDEILDTIEIPTHEPELWIVAFELWEDGGSGWPRAFVLGCGLVSRRANGDGDNGFGSGRRKRSTDYVASR